MTDNLTGLIWLENADCAPATMNWAAALNFANTLFDGSVAHNGGDCGLSDDSAEGAWRLPNVRELQSLCTTGCLSCRPEHGGYGQMGRGDPFSGVQSSTYRSSTTYAGYPEDRLAVVMGYGIAATAASSLMVSSVWPVRGGQ